MEMSSILYTGRGSARLLTPKDIPGWGEVRQQIYHSRYYAEDRITDISQGQVMFLGDLSANEKIIIEDSIIGGESIDNASGLALEFAGLSSEYSVINFAQKYGLLGLEPSHGLSGDFCSPNNGVLKFEPLKAWLWKIREINDLMRIYRYARMGRIREARSEITFGKNEEHQEAYVALCSAFNPQIQEDLGVLSDGFGSVVLPLANWITSDSKEQVAKFLACSIINELHDIYLGCSGFEPDLKAPIGFKILEVKATSRLLTAIYYDFWEMIRRNEDIYYCDYCGRPLKEKVKRQKYCNNSCKQAAWRQKQKEKSDIND